MLKNYLFGFFGLLLLLSALLYPTDWAFVPYAYAAASVGVAALFLLHPYKGDHFRLKRLNIQQAIAALLLPVSAYFMFRRMNEWIVCLLVSALLQTYVAFVREYEEKKNSRGND
jgi:membrane protease YdiL (CAAX protease family)